MMRRWLVRNAPTIVLFAAAALFAASLRRDLLRRNAELTADEVPPGRVAAGTIAPEGSLSGVILSSAATGVFRALAIDFLWIRAVRLQERGQFFEASALARFITSLQPRLATVWTFQSANLAYNITAALPIEERYSWVLEGIDLLRDRALRWNPGSPAICRQLAFTFQHKIGLDFDEAGYVYRSELARTFEADPSSDAGRAVLDAWKLRPEVLRELEDRLGVALDLRAAESHALYWAHLGLSSPLLDRDPLSRYILRLVWRGAILQLASGGRPARVPGGRWYAFLPDLRFSGLARETAKHEMEHLETRPDRLAAARDRYAGLLARDIYFHYLLGRAEAAGKLLATVRGLLGKDPGTLDDFLVEHRAFLLREPQGAETPGRPAPPPGDPAAGPWGDAMVRLDLATCLDAALLLDLAREPEAASGFRSLAALLLDRGTAGRSGPSLESLVGASARRLGGPWRDRAAVWSLVPPTLRELVDSTGPSAEDLALPPRPGELPFRLDLLDPLRGGGRP